MSAPNTVGRVSLKRSVGWLRDRFTAVVLLVVALAVVWVPVRDAWDALYPGTPGTFTITRHECTELSRGGRVCQWYGDFVSSTGGHQQGLRWNDDADGIGEEIPAVVVHGRAYAASNGARSEWLLVVSLPLLAGLILLALKLRKVRLRRVGVPQTGP